MSTMDPAGREGWRELSRQQLLECIFLDSAYPVEPLIERLCGQNAGAAFRFGVIGLYGRDWNRLERKLLFETFEEILCCITTPELLLLLIHEDAECCETAERMDLWFREHDQTLQVAWLEGSCRLQEARQTRTIFEAAAAEMFFHAGTGCLPLSLLSPSQRPEKLEEKDLRRLRQLRRELSASLVRGDAGGVSEKLDIYCDISARGDPAVFREQCMGLYFWLKEELTAPDEKQGKFRGALYRLDNSVFRLLEEADSAAELREHLTWYMDQLLAWYRPLRADTHSRVTALVEEYIGKYYMEPVVIEDIAAEAGLSANYIRSIFKNSRGKTIQRYLSDYRLEMACRLLQNTSATVSKVGQMVGYNNVSYFCAAFQKRYGKTPSEWRRDL